MENLKKLVSKILEKQGISHEKLKPKKWEINNLREYLQSVWYRLEITYYNIYSPRFTNKWFIKNKELIEKRSYRIFKLN